MGWVSQKQTAGIEWECHRMARNGKNVKGYGGNKWDMEMTQIWEWECHRMARIHGIWGKFMGNKWDICGNNWKFNEIQFMGYPLVRRERFGATVIHGPTQWGAIRSQAEFPNHMIAVSKMLIECDQQDMTFPLEWE